MMAVIGFLALLALGLFFVAGALVSSFVSLGFGGRVEWTPFVIFGAIGGALLYVAFTHCPFTISMIG